jgi:single-strand DNA-binding protein
MVATKSAASAPTKHVPTNAAATKAGSRGSSRAAVVEGHNEVVLGGRVSGEPTVRVLPSGDELVSWRLVVGRDNRGVSPTGRQLPTVDTIDCVAFKAGVRRTAARWAGGEVIEVRGELRRRFWRGAQGAASRCEVEVLEIRKISAAP